MMKPVKSDDEKIFRKLQPKEKIWILLVVILIVLLSIKSIYLDPFKPVSPEEVQHLEVAQTFTEDYYDGFLYKYHILDIRIIKIRPEDHTLKVQARKYVFGFFPFGDQYLILDN